MARSSAAPERLYPQITWESHPMRAERRIRRQMDAVLRLCFAGLTLSQVARIPGGPGLRTMRRWASENLYSFRAQYWQFRREHVLDRLRVGIEADYRQILGRAQRRNRTRERTR
jgi:hypothetical protein